MSRKLCIAMKIGLVSMFSTRIQRPTPTSTSPSQLRYSVRSFTKGTDIECDLIVNQSTRKFWSESKVWNCQNPSGQKELGSRSRLNPRSQAKAKGEERFLDCAGQLLRGNEE